MVQIKTLSPVDQTVVVERPESTDAEIKQIFDAAAFTFKTYAKVPLAERIQIATRFLDIVTEKSDELAREITLQMGRPVRYTPIEIKTAVMRGRYMIKVAEEQLKDVQADNSDPKIRKFLRRIPKGPVFVIGAWNYPWLITINAVLPALIAGNTVVLKPSPQTPLVAERFVDLYHKAGLPEFALQCVHIGSPDIVAKICQRPEVKHISFTGSVAGGRAVDRASAVAERDSFISVGLELGGKDPAYVRPDIDPKVAAIELVDGVMFNSGQSCCAVERIYVHESIYDDFVKSFVEETKTHVLGDPQDAATTLGPVVSLRSAEAIRKQVADAVKDGAKALIEPGFFPADKPGTCFVGPQVLTNVTHKMACMTEETFGPIVGIQKVRSDAEAIELMNDSVFGLTASVWSNDEDGKVQELLEQLEAGTVFGNRCDYPDPSLAWTGCKQSGRGVTLSRYAFESFVTVRSFHLKTL